MAAVGARVGWVDDEVMIANQSAETTCFQVEGNGG